MLVFCAFCTEIIAWPIESCFRSRKRSRYDRVIEGFRSSLGDIYLPLSICTIISFLGVAASSSYMLSVWFKIFLIGSIVTGLVVFLLLPLILLHLGPRTPESEAERRQSVKIKEIIDKNNQITYQERQNHIQEMQMRELARNLKNEMNRSSESEESESSLENMEPVEQYEVKQLQEVPFIVDLVTKPISW